MDLFRNETSLYADYLLPMATGIEKGGTTRFAEDRRIVWNDRLIDPPGEAKSDHWFWIELGKRFGFSDLLKEEYKHPRTLWDEVLCVATPALRGITTQRLLARPNRQVRIPVATQTAEEIDTLYLEGTTAFGQPDGKRFPTPSGKLEFWTEQLEQRFSTLGLSALPEFYSEREQLIDLPFVEKKCPEDPRVVSPFFHTENYVQPTAIVQHTDPEKMTGYRQEYDTELVTGRPPAPHFHSWTHYFWQAQEMWPELYCQIHPDKAILLGIADGDQVRVETVSGRVQARAWLYRGIRKSAVFIPIGWDRQQPYHPADTVNHLTGLTLDPISQQPNLKVHLCKLSRV
jgi:anaerobic selenocysteine-containing dehydrogenase